MAIKINANLEKKNEGVSSLEVTKDTEYLFKKPSDESVSIRKEHDDPFCATIKRKDIKRMQQFFRLNRFYERLDQAGIVGETQYNPMIHQGYRRGFYQSENPDIALILFHKDEKILHDLMEEFVTRDLVKTYGWKKLKHFYVN